MNDPHQVLAYADGINLIGNYIRTIERNADLLLNIYKDVDLAVNIGEFNCMDDGKAPHSRQ
jgi:hypothetical protein